jgi:hypothetical protein
VNYFLLQQKSIKIHHNKAEIEVAKRYNFMMGLKVDEMKRYKQA